MRARVLPREEWPRLPPGDGLPELLGLMEPDQAEVVVVEAGERIVGNWGVLRLTHLEGAWIDPAYRNAGVVRPLLRLTMARAGQWSGRWALTGARTDEVRSIIGRLGGVKLPMDNYMFPVRR